MAAEIITATRAFTGTVGQAIATSFAIAEPTEGAAAQTILDAPHESPARFNPSNPITLFCIQAGIVIILARILAIGLGKLKQPRVISEVVAGILLGPTAFGRIPGFTESIFPQQSLSYLNLVATIGLVLFLFLVGLEVDFSVFKKNATASVSISVVGLLIPFGLGAAVATGLYDRFVDPEQVEFSHFLLFIAVAMSITAFPVLARILTELKLLQTDVGVAVLAAGVGNDVVGWILLALTVALVNAGGGLSALYVLLCCVGWTLILVFAVRPVFIYLCRKSGSFENGPSNGIMVVLIIIILASSFVTDIIGVHPIFGGFLAGVIMPHHRGFAESLTEKLEDLVATLFLPLYFALSGLKTDLGLLNNGAIWGWAIAVIVVAFFSKFLGCAGTAKLNKYTWRESAAVGSLMSCKGLVELIVLNIGLQAGILNDEIFAMFVLMALVTTFLTTPLTLLFYPAWYRQEMIEKRAAAKSEDSPSADDTSRGSKEDKIRSRFTFVFNRMEDLPSMMAFTKLIQLPPKYSAKEIEASGKSTLDMQSTPVGISAIRLLELSERYSSVLKASDLETTARQDPLSNIYGTFAGLNGFKVVPEMAIVVPQDFPLSVTNFAKDKKADMIVVPWAAATSMAPTDEGPAVNPFENLFRNNAAPERSPQYAAFVRETFLKASCDVALFLDRGIFGAPSAMPSGRQHIYLPFFGGPDDRASLELVMQLCRHQGVTATIVRLVRSAEPTEEDRASSDLSKTSSGLTAPESSTPVQHFTVHGGVPTADTVYAAHNTQYQLQSETADNLAMAHFFPPEGSEAISHPASTTDALSRATFTVVNTVSPLKTSLVHATKAAEAASAPLLVITGRSRRGGISHREELDQFLKTTVATSENGIAALGLCRSSEVRRTLGDCASALVVAGVAGSVLVVQAGTKATQSA